MKTILIHCNTIGGHYLEYLHHIYIGALYHTQDSYVFVVPAQFKEKSLILDWPITENVKITFMDKDDKCLESKGIIQDSINLSKSLKKYVRLYNATDVILVSLISYLPFLPIYINSDVRIKGIVYRIYLYEWKSEKLLKKIQDVLKYFIFSKFKVFDKVFILNDSSSASYLNKMYRTSKFRYICDPFPRLSIETNNLRKELNIPLEKKIVLHPGDLCYRKGTIALLKGISACDASYLDNYCFIFAGRVNSAIKEEFFKLIEEINNKSQCLLFIEGFVSFDYLASLVYTCDYLFLPYIQTCQSSGMIGYGAEYKRHVITTQNGLLGKLVKKYRLGYTIKDTSINSISDFLKKMPNEPYNDNQYLYDNNVKKFIDIIL